MTTCCQINKRDGMSSSSHLPVAWLTWTSCWQSRYCSGLYRNVWNRRHLAWRGFALEYCTVYRTPSETLQWSLSVPLASLRTVMYAKSNVISAAVWCILVSFRLAVHLLIFATWRTWHGAAFTAWTATRWTNACLLTCCVIRCLIPCSLAHNYLFFCFNLFVGQSWQANLCGLLKLQSCLLTTFTCNIYSWWKPLKINRLVLLGTSNKHKQ